MTADTYYWMYWGMFSIITLILVQFVVAVRAHRKQEHYIPGKIDDSLGHQSFVFRSHRTYINSLESFLPFLALVWLAVGTGVAASTLAMVVWIFFVARLIHCVLYYAIATDKNPSPRSYFWAIGFLTTLALVVLNAMALLST